MFKRTLIAALLVASAALADGGPLGGDEKIQTIGSPRNTILVSEIAAYVRARSAPASADIIPSRHLSNLIGKTAATACMIGDSTMTPLAVAGLAVDPSQLVWWGLQEKLRASNPQIAWTFANFAIGGANEANPIQTGTASGLPLPSWFTVAGNTWLSYVQAQNCDVLFWGFGTNASNAGTPSAPGSNAANFLAADLAVVNGWAKIPNIIFVTTKSANPDTDTSGDDAVSGYHKAQAAFHRTFASTVGGGYTSFPLVSALGFGLVDLGRDFTARVDGFDPASQYLRSRPDCLVSGRALGFAAVAGANATTVCTTTGGDYRLSFTIVAGGGTTLFGYGGGNALQIGLSGFIGNYIRIAIGGSGNMVPRYILDGAISGSPSQVGTSVNTTNAADVQVVVTAVGSHVQVTINGTLSLDVEAPRFVSALAGGTPINVGFVAAPTGSPTINVTEFFEGVGVPTLKLATYASAFGVATTCNAKAVDCQGGNSINHARGNSWAMDKQVIDALNFAVPASVLASFTVATLPTCATAITGTLVMVTDATAPTYNGALTGGGGVIVPVFCNGAAWASH